MVVGEKGFSKCWNESKPWPPTPQYPASPSGNRLSPGRWAGGGRGGKVAAQLGQLCRAARRQRAETAAAASPVRLTSTRRPVLHPECCCNSPEGGLGDCGREREAGREPSPRVQAEPQKAALHVLGPRRGVCARVRCTPNAHSPSHGATNYSSSARRGSGKQRRAREQTSARKQDRRPPGGSRTFSSSMSRFVDLSMERN